MKEALAEELRARVAEALAAKMEEVEQIDESMEKTHHAARVGTTTWGVGKTPEEAVKDAHKAIHSYYASSAPTRNDKNIDAHMARADKTKKALKVHPIRKSVYDKYATESFDLDEAGAVITHKWYSVKHWKDGSAHHDNLDDHLRGHEYKHAALGNTSRNRPDHHIGIPVKAKAAIAYMDKHAKPVNEEAEQIDEISKETLGSYIKKAAPSAVSKYTQADRLNRRAFDADNKEADKYFDASDRAYKKHKNRLAGIEKATDRLTK